MRYPALFSTVERIYFLTNSMKLASVCFMKVELIINNSKFDECFSSGRMVLRGKIICFLVALQEFLAT